MNDAITLFFQIYSKFIQLVFEDLDIGGGVTIGWVIVVCFVFYIVIRNILALPSRSGALHVGSSNDNH